MYNNKQSSKFSKIIRIRPNQLEWLRENKDTKTLAGYLDKIINKYKNE